MTRIKTIIFLSIFFVAGCMSPGTKSPKFLLDISFKVNLKQGIQPSYSTVIWLEKPDGSYVKTLYISEYLSLGGYNVSYVCPDWSAKANWAQIPRDAADAVTGATPMIGKRNYSFNFSKNELPPGPYKYFIEVHLSDEYNELYSGEINIPCTEKETEPQVAYIPEKHSKAGDILSYLTVNCN